MSIKKQVVNFVYDFKYSEITNLDLIDLKKEIFSFYAHINVKNKSPFDMLLSLTKARTHLNNAIMLSKTYIEPERNIYINAVNDELGSYRGFSTYLGIANAILDITQDSLMLSIERGLPTEAVSLIIRIEKFRHLLIEYMETMVIYSFINSYQKFSKFNPDTDKEGNKVVKDYDLFCYFLFLEFYHSAETLGALSRRLAVEKKLSSVKDDVTDGKIPPEIPTNAKKEKDDEFVEQQATITEFSKDPFEVEDV